jgi:hypothetical protein
VCAILTRKISPCTARNVGIYLTNQEDHFETPTIASPGYLLLHYTMNEFIYRDIPNLPSQDDVIAAFAKKGDRARQLTYSPKTGSSSNQIWILGDNGRGENPALFLREDPRDGITRDRQSVWTFLVTPDSSCLALGAVILLPLMYYPRFGRSRT